MSEKDQLELADRVAIVTGGASGIGRASCLELARAGARVVIADIDEKGGRTTAEKIGERALFVRTDVAQAGDAQRLAGITKEHFGRIDILYNNAAATTLAQEKDRAVHELDEAVWNKMIDVSLKSVFLCSKYVLPHMMAQNRGVILNMTSIDALIVEPGYDSYTAAKGGIISLTRSMAVEYAKYNIRVNAISPGYIVTECQEPYFKNPEFAAKARALHLTRVGRPEDIAQMARYLVSDKAEFITAAVIPVDGGFTAFKSEPLVTYNTPIST